MSRQLSQRKIAKALGVSQSLVSVVLSGAWEGRVSEAKARRILAHARARGYRFSGGNKTSGAIALFACMLDQADPIYSLYNEYFGRVIAGVQRACEENGRELIVRNWREAVDPGSFRLKVDGVIISAATTDEHVRMLCGCKPVVLLNREHVELTCDTVVPDNAGGMQKAVSALYRLEHKRIALFAITGEVRDADRHHQERVAAYKRSLAEFNLKVPASFVRTPTAGRRTMAETEGYAREALQRWKALAKPPTAVIATNDLYAASLLKAAARLGLKVPRDLSIIGFDNIPACNYFSPTLSSISQPLEDMARASVDLLCRRIASGSEETFRKVTCDTTLVVRESIGPIRR